MRLSMKELTVGDIIYHGYSKYNSLSGPVMVKRFVYSGSDFRMMVQSAPTAHPAFNKSKVVEQYFIEDSQDAEDYGSLLLYRVPAYRGAQLPYADVYCLLPGTKTLRCIYNETPDRPFYTVVEFNLEDDSKTEEFLYINRPEHHERYMALITECDNINTHQG